MIERWGTFSVKDHVDTRSLVSDVLMYDRLVFPVPPGDVERADWRRRRWDPDLLARRLEQLGDRAVKVPWGGPHRRRYDERMEKVRALAWDARTAIPDDQAFRTTRLVLAMDDPIKLPRGVSKVRPVAAYRSPEDVRGDFLLDEQGRDPALLSVLVRNRLPQPLFSRDPERSLELAIELSRDAAFREKRRAIYAWQEEMLSADVRPSEALLELEDLIARYDAQVRSAHRIVAYRLVFTVLAGAVPVAGALLATAPGIALAAAAASASMGLVRFGTLERKPVFNAGETAPAAMFHQLESQAG